MSDCIEREALLAEYDRQHKGEPGGARKLIENAPAADVQPIRHGRWINRGKSPYNDMFTVYECSECGVKFQNMVSPERFCGNCGAKMDGGAE